MVSTIRRAVSRDWRESRAIRLEALQDAPLAFATTHAQAADFSEEVWRQRIVDSAQFLAILDGVVVGTATGLTDPEDSGVVLLVAMYVTPAARGKGIGEQLVSAVVAQARADGARRVRLYVVETNSGAERLYARCGFVRTGATIPLPHRPDLLEQEMTLDLT